LERAGVLKAIRTPTGVRIFNLLDIERFAQERGARSAARAAGPAPGAAA
jgi:hypothetical protein